MKAIERIAIVVCVAEVLRLLVFFCLEYIIDVVLDDLGFGEKIKYYWIQNVPRILVWLLVNLMVAGWVYVDAPRHRISRPVWVALALTSGILGLAVYLLRVLIGKYESGQQPARTCMKCGYNLTGNASGICPECGTPISIPDQAPIPKPQ